MNFARTSLLVLLFLSVMPCAPSPARAAAPSPADNAASPLRLTRDTLARSSGIWIGDGWRARAGDSALWARADLDDSAWETIGSPMTPAQPRPRHWQGIGWFRRHLDVDTSLMNVQCALLLYQAGACEIYLDGRMIARCGRVGTSPGQEVSSQSQDPIPFSFPSPGRHVIAVRFSNFSAEGVASDFYAGFNLCLGKSGALQAQRIAEINDNQTTRMIFGVVPLTLALLHLILFAFYPRLKANLYYSLCMIGFAGIVFGTTQSVFASSFGESITFVRLSYLAENTAIVFGLLLLYSSAQCRIPMHGRVLIGTGAVLALCAFIHLRLVMRVQDIFLVLVVAEMIRGTLFAQGGPRTGNGEWIIAAGTGVLIITLIFQLLIGYEIIAPIAGLRNGYLYGALALSISMSIYLSRRFAQTNFDLERQLAQIRELSDRALEQERQAREGEIERRLLEADNQRKTAELEDARKVQLSMLPACMNTIPGYDLCFSMRTATEIGGDYYDYALTPDGTLNVVIGDATGHGMRSALMVAAVKSMFSAMGTELGITEFFGRATGIIKDMNLGNLFMSMTLLRAKDGEFELSAAGMPPLLHYRAAEGRLERILIKGMPLGAHRSFPYETRRMKTGPGDILVLMSDGFTELFNERGVMLEHEQIERTIVRSAGCTASEIARALYETGDAWRGAKAQDDDITFVVIRILH